MTSFIIRKTNYTLPPVRRYIARRRTRRRGRSILLAAGYAAFLVAMPEPATLAPLAAGAAMLMLVRKRRIR
jgi:hypothetical protein